MLVFETVMYILIQFTIHTSSLQDAGRDRDRIASFEQLCRIDSHNTRTCLIRRDRERERERERGGGGGGGGRMSVNTKEE